MFSGASLFLTIPNYDKACPKGRKSRELTGRGEYIGSFIYMMASLCAPAAVRRRGIKRRKRTIMSRSSVLPRNPYNTVHGTCSEGCRRYGADKYGESEKMSSQSLGGSRGYALPKRGNPSISLSFILTSIEEFAIINP